MLLPKITLVPVFTKQKKSEENCHFYEKSEKAKIAIDVCCGGSAPREWPHQPLPGDHTRRVSVQPPEPRTLSPFSKMCPKASEKALDGFIFWSGTFSEVSREPSPSGGRTPALLFCVLAPSSSLRNRGDKAQPCPAGLRLFGYRLRAEVVPTSRND